MAWSGAVVVRKSGYCRPEQVRCERSWRRSEGFAEVPGAGAAAALRTRVVSPFAHINCQIICLPESLSHITSAPESILVKSHHYYQDTKLSITP